MPKSITAFLMGPPYNFVYLYAIAKSAIGLAPQAATKNSEVEQVKGCLQHAVLNVLIWNSREDLKLKIYDIFQIHVQI